jgi:4a-hydroxytetrahydrobiopterin dehydratase
MSAMELSRDHCISFKKGDGPLPGNDVLVLAESIPAWTLSEKKIERLFAFEDFKASIAFVNKVAAIAEEQNHHPDIAVFYNKVKVTLSTHKVDGLTRNDFIVAAKIDNIPVK